MKQRRDDLQSWIKNDLNIDESRVWSALGIKGIADVGVEELMTLIGIRTSINDKETTIDEAFPPKEFSPKETASDIQEFAMTGSAEKKSSSKKDVPQKVWDEIEHSLAIADKMEHIETVENGYPELKNNKHFISLISKSKIAWASKNK